MVMRGNAAVAMPQPARRARSKRDQGLIGIAKAMKSAARSGSLYVPRAPTGATARERLYALMCEMGDLFNGRQHGWKCEVARQLNIPQTTALAIIRAGERGDLRSVRPETVDYAIAASRIPPAAFYDSEFRG